MIDETFLQWIIQVRRLSFLHGKSGMNDRAHLWVRAVTLMVEADNVFVFVTSMTVLIVTVMVFG